MTAPEPEDDKPRFLLPDGCKDLIDALPKRTPAIRKTMYVYDQHGNSLGPPQEIPEPDSVPMGLAALPGYVLRFCVTAGPTSSLTVSTQDDQRGLALVRLDGTTQILFSVSARDESGLEQGVRKYFECRSIKPTHDYLSTGDTTRYLHYPLPASPDDITAICRELLTECFGTQPNETLHYMLNKVG